MLTLAVVDELARLRIAYLSGDIGKVPVIKKVRELTGYGLFEAKEYVEAWANENDADAKVKSIRERLHHHIDNMSNSQVLELARTLFIW